jgi:hypothetical protein
MLQPGQELSPEEVVAMKRDEETTRLSTLLATPMGKAMFSDGPEYTPEEVVTMQAAEAQAEIPAEQVLVQQVLELNDPNAPDQPKDEWRRRTQLKKTLQEQGLLDSDFMATAKGVGGLVVTIADGVTSPLRYDPRNENGDVIPAKDGLEYISRYNPVMWPAAVSDAINRSPATLNYAGELLQQGYGIMNDGLAGLGGPRYKIKETGEFITEMDRAMYRTKVAQTGGLAGDPSDDALIKQYAAQGMTLEPVTPEDVEEFEYQQHLRFRGRLKSIEQKRTEGAGPEVATSSLMTAGAAPLDWLTGSNYMDQVWGKKLPAESQAMVMQMGADPLVWTSFGAGLTRLGVSTAAKGGGARILDAIGKGAQKMARPTEQSLREVQRFQNAVWSKGRVALYAGGLAGMNYSSLPEPLKNAMNVAAAAYVIHKGGAGTLRWVGDKFPQAAVMLREAADPLNGADIMARQAIAKNPKIPAGIRERVAKPSQFMAMESTPARLARNETLSPKTRKMMERLSNFYVVQGVRGASAVATGATKGAIVSAPFAELTRGGGDEEGANLIYGAGTALGGTGGAASRVLGARNRTVARAESDIGRMLVDIQATVPELQRQGAVKRNQWFDRELNRFLTDVELAGGDIAHMFQARSFDEIARTAAMQGLFRNVDYVPLNDADFALNAKAHGQSGAAGFYLHNPDGARPRLFVNLDARRADVDAHEFGEAFFSSDAFSPEQKAAMRAEVDARYGPEGVMARAREYAEQMIKSENARNFPNENLVVSDDQIRAKMDELAQDELGRGGQDSADWARREIMVEEWRMAGTDYARLRRGVPAGANPVTFVENILGANARALGLSGVRIDPETGKAITPDQLFKENPVAADDPIVNRNLRAYIKTYNTWLNDPSQEVPSGVKVARDGNVQSLANNPNVDFYSINPDDPTAPRENTFGVLGPDGRVVEKQPKQRRDERKARNSQVKNMAGRNLLAPGDAAFGLKRWGDGRVRAGGRRLPQSIILQNHWKPWLPIINMLEGMADSGESVQVRYFAVGNSADKVKTAKLKDVDAINREMVFDQWTTNAAGDLLAQFLDLAAMRNRAMRAIGERNPALDPANGGPGYSLQAIMDDVNQWMADKRAGKAGEATIGPDRKNIVNALINPGTTLNRGKNPLAGSMGKGSAIKTLILEGINAVSGTGRKGAAMDYNWANGNFMPDQPPRPDVDIDLPQESMPQQVPREAQGMPDAPASGRSDGMPEINITPDEARRQGLIGPVYHGSPDFKGRKFDPKYRARSSGLSRGGFSFTEDVASADSYAGAGVDSAQAAVDAANDVMRDLGARMEAGLKLREFADVSEVPEFNVRYADDMDELASYFNDLSKRIPKDLGARLRDAAKAINEPANPVVVEAYLRNPKEMMIDGKRLLVAENPDDIFVSAARPPQDAPSAAPRGQAMPDAVPADAPPFYMKSTQVLDAKIQGKAATVDQVRAILTNPQNGIKAEELKWTGALQAAERLAKENSGKVPKDALLKYLADDGAVRLEEVRMGLDKNRINPQSPYAIPEVMRYAGDYQGNAPDAMLITIMNDGDVYRALEQRFPELIERDDWAEVVVNDVFGGVGNTQEGRFAQYQLAGGENYREVVMTMPNAALEKAANNLREFEAQFKSRPIPAEAKPQHEALRQAVADAKQQEGYTSSHYQDTPNYVAHMRLNERTDAAGKAGLFLEEIQSDRHQAGREKGYLEDRDPKALEAAIKEEERLSGELQLRAQELRSENGFPSELRKVMAMGPEAKMRHDAIRDADARYVDLRDGLAAARLRRNSLEIDSNIPDAPFRKDWPVQMFKRALADAVSSGKEWIGWTTGETQAARYDLSKQINMVSAMRLMDGGYLVYMEGKDGGHLFRNQHGFSENGQRRFTPDELKEFIGKEAAENVLRGADNVKPDKDGSRDWYDSKPADLKVGGEGMKGFYDQILPKEISKYVKQWGAQVEKSRIGQPKKHSGKLTRDELAEAKRDAKALINGDIDVAEFNDNWGTRLTDDDVPGSDPYRLNESATDLVSVVRKERELDAGGAFEAWRVNITPQMRESIKKAGQALFVGGMAAVVAEEEL